MPRIRGQIIRILSRREVIINLGAKDGVQSGNIFAILGEAEPVMDPISKEELGRVLVVKSRVAASQVYDKFTIATTKWTTLETSFALGLLRGETIDEGELRVEPTEIEPWKARSEVPVHVGDTVEVEVKPKPKEESAKKSAKEETPKKSA